ncbi:MAG: hypothetical protein ACRDRO_12170 [Pseudonocardiaceae bacterium]
MSLAYLAQPEQQPTVEWLAGGTFTVLLDAAATNGQLGVGRLRVSQGEAPPYRKHLREDEVFMLITGTALLWCDEEEMERPRAELCSCRGTSRTVTASRRPKLTC